MTEREDAIKLANKVLETPGRDPDDDLSVLARQFMRLMEMMCPPNREYTIAGVTFGSNPLNRFRPPSAEELYIKALDPPRICTCHPDDNPPVPCPGKHAFSECVEAAAKSHSPILESEGGLRCNVCGESWASGAVRVETDEGPMLAVTNPSYAEYLAAHPPRPAPSAAELHIRALERAIEAEGYRIMIEARPGKVTLEKRCLACNDSGVASENYPESGGAGMPCPLCCSPVPQDGTHSITEAFTPDWKRK